MLTKYNQQINKAFKEQNNYQFATGLTKKVKPIKLQIGKYVIDFPKLKKENILSISYPNNNKKVNGFPNLKVSDSVKK